MPSGSPDETPRAGAEPAGGSRAEAFETVRRGLRHDLRNPLAVILGRCEMLEGGALGTLSEPQQRSVAIIQRNAARVVDALDALVHALEHLDPGDAPPRTADAGVPPEER